MVKIFPSEDSTRSSSSLQTSNAFEDYRIPTETQSRSLYILSSEADVDRFVKMTKEAILREGDFVSIKIETTGTCGSELGHSTKMLREIIRGHRSFPRNKTDYDAASNDTPEKYSELLEPFRRKRYQTKVIFKGRGRLMSDLD